MTYKEVMHTIRANYHSLTRSQFKTLKGQAKTGDLEGALKGLRRLLNDPSR